MNGLSSRAFPSINEPHWIGVFGHDTVVESEYNIQVKVASGHLLVFAGAMRQLDGKEDVFLVRYLTGSPELSILYITNPPL